MYSTSTTALTGAERDRLAEVMDGARYCPRRGRGGYRVWDRLEDRPVSQISSRADCQGIADEMNGKVCTVDEETGRFAAEAERQAEALAADDDRRAIEEAQDEETLRANRAEEAEADDSGSVLTDDGSDAFAAWCDETLARQQEEAATAAPRVVSATVAGETIRLTASTGPAEDTPLPMPLGTSEYLHLAKIAPSPQGRAFWQEKYDAARGAA